MRPEVHGEPVHTRALGTVLAREADGTLSARGYLLDLRTRGFLPLAGSMQGMGIIHHMEVAWTVDPETLVVRAFEPGQPTVAFEATPETDGESCRDPIGRVRELAGIRLGDGFARRLRESIGGALGCSHILTLSLFMDAAVRTALGRDCVVRPGRWRGAPRPATIARRDLVFDAHEVQDGEVEVVVRLGDLDWGDASPDVLAPQRFARHLDLAATVRVDLWPGSLVSIEGAERERTADHFVGVGWTDRTAALRPLVGLGLARGAAGELMRRLGDDATMAPWCEAMLQLAPALVQCRAAHGDAWHAKVRRSPHHPGLTAIPDSCYMWRRGGALERIRDRQGACTGGR